MTRSIDLVVNPTAGAGRAARAAADVSRELARVGFAVRTHPTLRAGHAAEIVARLIAERVEAIGVVGGDGTFKEALGGLAAPRVAGAEPPVFALVPAGTGGDLRKTLDVPQDPRGIAEYLRDAAPRAFDIGELSYVSHDGELVTDRFGNIASFGIGGLVDQIVNRGPKWLGGRVSFFVGSLRASMAYRNAVVRVFVDDEEFYEGPILNVAVANGRAFGGGMMVAPMADPHDGLFDVVVMGDLSQLEATLLAPRLYRGTHLDHPKVRHRRGRVVRAEAVGARAALLDIDGEAPGHLAATFRIAPGAIRMLERA